MIVFQIDSLGSVSLCRYIYIYIYMVQSVVSEDNEQDKTSGYCTVPYVFNLHNKNVRRSSNLVYSVVTVL